MKSLARGFTLIELLIVIAILGIIMALTIPGLREWSLRKQIREGIPLARVGMVGVENVWANTGKLPADNVIASVPPSNKIIGNVITDVKIVNGVVTITYGNNSGKNLEGKKISFRPAVVVGFRDVPIAWVCGSAPTPKGMEVQGTNETDIETVLLPVECRGPAAS
ncbi:pilin [Usitatibacter palustris]|uniref:Fimbrial protein n=1 Tax=Usitatibacter palustris TaxID=2732487 RepID=A0A6M4H8B4_9PROT|nr:pilin [Usitatibacter palustris]QJR15856.1 Fimbrial protein [Usitatibacter palustris]